MSKRSINDLRLAAQRVCEYVKADQSEESQRRSTRARDIVRAAYTDSNVAFYVQTDIFHTYGHMTIKRPRGITRNPKIGGDLVACDCPDFDNGFTCKHVRALAGLILLKTKEDELEVTQ